MTKWEMDAFSGETLLEMDRWLKPGMEHEDTKRCLNCGRFLPESQMLAFGCKLCLPGCKHHRHGDVLSYG